MGFQELTIPLILALYYALLASAAPFSRRQICITNPILYTSFEETLTLSVQNKSHPLHNRAIYYTSRGDETTGPVEHAMTIYRSSPLPPAAFRLTSQKLYHPRPKEYPSRSRFIPNRANITALRRPISRPHCRVLSRLFGGAGILGVTGILVPSSWSWDLTGGDRKVCAKPNGPDWRIYLQSGCKLSPLLPLHLVVLIVGVGSSVLM